MPRAAHPLVSCVVPVRNEAGTVAELHRRFVAVAAAAGWAYQLIYVDDGSTDDTWAAITALVARDPGVVGVRLGRSAGILEAIAVGLGEATGDACCTIDGDLEARPEDLPPLVGLALDGVDMVSGYRANQRSRPPERWLASGTLRTVMWFAPHRPRDFGCGMKAFTPDLVRRVLDDEHAGTGLPFAFALLRAARSYEERPVPWVDQDHQSHFSARALARNLAAFTAMTFRTPVARWRRRSPAAVGALAALAAVPGSRSRRLGALGAATAAGLSWFGAADLHRRAAADGRPGSSAQVVDRIGPLAGGT